MKIQTRYAATLAVIGLLSSFAAIAAQEEAKILSVQPAPAHETQQERMKRCNVEAKEKALKGEDRRAFMSACLKH